ncbi:MAG TPA: hypothetical protein VFD75_16040, partial [Pyrinomonadaceae bacterium]|nr:hypothetical protein [Pyrinomonadaceae bacterium]
VIGQIVELCSAVRLSVFVCLHVEGEVKQFILETIKNSPSPRADAPSRTMADDDGRVEAMVNRKRTSNIGLMRLTFIS